MDGGRRAQSAWRRMARRGLHDAVWELYDTQDRLVAGARPRQRTAGEAARAPAPVPHRSCQAQRAAARGSRRRASQPRYGRRPVLARTAAPAAVSGDRRLNAFSVISIKNKSHRVTAEVMSPRLAVTASSSRKEGSPEVGRFTSKEGARSTATTSTGSISSTSKAPSGCHRHAPRSHGFQVRRRWSGERREP